MSNWKVPFIDLPAEYKELGFSFPRKLKDVFYSGRFILGEQVEKFEESMSEYLGVKQVIGVNSGTDALFLSLKLTGVVPGDEVITVAHTHISTVAVIKHLGATPILVDIDEDFNMDTSKIGEAITSHTRVIIPVHLNGHACQMDQIMSLAYKYNLDVVEDACQSLGAMFKGKKTGTFGTGCFSTHPLKTLSSAGDGGFIATNDTDLADRVRLLRNHGTLDKISYSAWGYNSRLDELQALTLNLKLPYLQKYLDKRRQIAQLYFDGLGTLEKVMLPTPPLIGSTFYDTYNSYVIRVVQRDNLVQFLKKMGVETSVSWSIPLHLQEGLNLGYYKNKLPITERISIEVISLPIFPQMTNEQVDYVVDCIREFYG